MPNYCEIEPDSTDVGMCTAETHMQQASCDYHKAIRHSLACRWRHQAGWCVCHEAQQQGRKDSEDETGKTIMQEVR